MQPQQHIVHGMQCEPHRPEQHTVHMRPCGRMLLLRSTLRESMLTARAEPTWVQPAESVPAPHHFAWPVPPAAAPRSCARTRYPLTPHAVMKDQLLVLLLGGGGVRTAGWHHGSSHTLPYMSGRLNTCSARAQPTTACSAAAKVLTHTSSNSAANTWQPSHQGGAACAGRSGSECL